jgi:hypothetical protein
VVSKERYMYLDVSFKHPHLADAPQESECVTVQKLAQGSGVREGVAQGGFAYF